mmetsp:Transcript_37717/g.59685  ORF Transcript_37717/g.59685 Transcript_37717/m.59685 type:complete len:163 (-) Transcript_37717:3-491(-)
MVVVLRLVFLLACSTLRCTCSKLEASHLETAPKPLASLLFNLQRSSQVHPRRLHSFAMQQTLQSRRSKPILEDAAPEGEDVAPTITKPPKKEKTFEGSFNKNFGSAEATEKTLKKVGRTLESKAFWRNPVVFWSVVPTFGLLAIVLYFAVFGNGVGGIDTSI